MQAKAAIGLDVGGTRVKAVVVEDEGTVLDQVVRQSLENGVERWAEVAQALVQELIQQYGKELFVGVCAPGLADGDEKFIWNLPNRMPGIEGLVWQRFLGRPQAVPVLNDGQAALLGERWLGAAAGRQNVIMLTLGTGVGGAAIVDGRLLRPEGPSDPQGHAGARTRQASVGLPAAVRATHPRERHRRGDRGADRAYGDPGTAWL